MRSKGASKSARWAAALTLGLALAAADPVVAKEVVGWVQDIAFLPSGLVVKAKIDSGAKTSSLNVTHMEAFNRGGRRWVRFKVTNGRGDAAVFEQPVVRIARIKRENGRVEQVPVVMLELCLGSVQKTTQVDLNDRTGFNYQVLVGRRFLAGDFLIDPGRTFLAPPRCARAP